MSSQSFAQLTLKDVAYVVAKEFWNKWHNTAKQSSELEMFGN